MIRYTEKVKAAVKVYDADTKSCNIIRNVN